MKYTVGLILALAMVFGIAGASMAAPIAPGPGGHLFGFGEYNTVYSGGVLGAGFNITDNLSVGGYYAPNASEIGAFTNLAAGPFVVEMEVCNQTGSSFMYGQATALYTFNLGPVTMGIGGGTDFNNAGNHALIGKAAANLALGNLAIYGSVTSYGGSYLDYSTGMSLAL